MNILGTKTADSLVGERGTETIVGRRGSDYLSAGDAIDVTIHAGRGRDVLDGGIGYDVLFGGRGRDKFVFNDDLSPRNIDAIADFKPGKDKIVLDLDVFGDVRDPDGWFGTVIEYDDHAGRLSYLGETFAILRGDPHLTESDFIFV